MFGYVSKKKILLILSFQEFVQGQMKSDLECMPVLTNLDCIQVWTCAYSIALKVSKKNKLKNAKN